MRLTLIALQAFVLPAATMADLGPTLLALLGVPQPKEMTGKNLVVKKVGV